MDGYRAAVSLLPTALSSYLWRVSPAIGGKVQEIRLRAGQAVALGFDGKEWVLRQDGTVSDCVADGVCCCQEWLHDAAQRLVQYSPHSHTEELRRGFVTANGCRVGIAGTAITEHGTVTGYRAIDSLCLRVARVHAGCARPLLPILCNGGTVHSALLCGEPSCGKTSMLRDLAVQLTRQRLSVAVIDERGEIAGAHPLVGCDVLRYVPKPIGIEQAVRCLSPQVLLFDELGEQDEIFAVRDSALRGVPSIATVHGRSVDELYRRRALREALQDGVFEYLVLMHGRTRPGRVAQIVRTGDRERERNRDSLVDSHRGRLGMCGAAYVAPSLNGDATNRASAPISCGTDPLYGGTRE